MSPISVLTPTQERFLAGFFGDEASPIPFYLSGGTALAAYYLGHRYSDDLDFFTRDRNILNVAGRYVERAILAAGLQIERVEPKGDLIQYFFSGDPHLDHPLVKSEFIFDTPPYFANPRSFESVQVDDLLCIAVNKLTIHTRFDLKDYVDLYLIVQSGVARLEDLIPLAKEKMVGLDELTIAARFRKVGELSNLAEFQRNYMVTPIEPDELARFYEEWAARLFDLFPSRRQE